MIAFNILLTILLVLLNAFFVAAEFAIVKVRLSQIQLRGQAGSRAARVAEQIVGHLDVYLSATQLGITIASLGLGWIGEPVVSEIFIWVFGLFDISLAPATIHQIALPTAFFTITALHITLGELVPKSIALARPETIAAAVIGPVRLFALAFAPLARFLSAITDLIVILLGAKHAQEPVVTEEEIRVLIAQGAETGVFEKSEKDMVEGVLSLGDRRVTSLMTPRTGVAFIDLKDGPETARRLVVENARYAYLPAVDGDLDKVVGMLAVKECLAAIATNSFEEARSFLRAPVFVPESVSALKAFAALKAGGAKSALILDEYGGVSGLISLWDLVESIVGGMSGSGGSDEPEIIKRQDGSFLVDGSLLLDRFAQEFGRELKRFEDYDTVAGLVLDRMGTIPRPGDRCRWEDLLFEVLDMDGNRIDKILVTLDPDSAKPA